MFDAGCIHFEAFSSRSTRPVRSEEHTSELQSRVDISYAVFCLKKHTLNLVSLSKATRTSLNNVGAPLIFRNWFTCANTCLEPSRLFYNDPAATEIYTLSLHAALPI